MILGILVLNQSFIIGANKKAWTMSKKQNQTTRTKKRIREILEQVKQEGKDISDPILLPEIQQWIVDSGWPRKELERLISTMEK